MNRPVDLYGAYSQFDAEAFARVRRKTFGEDFGQNSWSAAKVSRRWHDARAEERDALVQIEGEERHLKLQHFFSAVHRLASERRLSRIAYLAEKRA